MLRHILILLKVLPLYFLYRLNQFSHFEYKVSKKENMLLFALH